MLEVRLLGPLQVVTDRRLLPLGPPKQQTVLAMLATRPGRIVTLEELIDELWPEAAPASAVANTRSYAGSLRRAFDQVDSARGLLSRCGPGYEFRVRPDDVDLLSFEAECERAGEALAAGDLAGADDLLRRAEQRWRGPMLSGVPLGPVLSARRTTAIEQRLGLVERRAELCLATGRPRQAIPMLRDHLRINPFREHGHALLIRAHYADGDVPAALNAFAAARALLVDQLGIGPGEELERLHKAVLNRSLPVTPRPERSSSAAGQAAGPGVVPHARRGGPTPEAMTNWLPRPLADFTGRTDTVRRLMETVERADPTAAIIQVIDGMPGVGKTALAVHVATRLTERFPDAQLFIDLQGHSTARPVDPATALVTLLRQLGVPTGRIPAELGHRIALWRSELGARRAIVVLDNAGGREQWSAVTRNVLLYLAVGLVTIRFGWAHLIWLPVVAYTVVCMVFGYPSSGGPRYHWWAVVMQEHTSVGQMVGVGCHFSVGLLSYLLPRPGGLSSALPARLAA